MIKRMANSPRSLLIVCLVALAVLSRLIPQPQNFAAVGAVGLFAGASFGNRWVSLLALLAAINLQEL